MYCKTVEGASRCIVKLLRVPVGVLLNCCCCFRRPGPTALPTQRTWSLSSTTSSRNTPTLQSWPLESHWEGNAIFITGIFLSPKL